MPFEQVKGLKHRSNAIFGAYNLPRPANLPDLLALMLSATVGSLDVAKQGVDLTVELHSNPRTVSVRLLHKSEAAWERQYQDDVTLADAMQPWTEAKGLSLNGLRLWQRTSVLSSDGPGPWDEALGDEEEEAEDEVAGHRWGSTLAGLRLGREVDLHITIAAEELVMHPLSCTTASLLLIWYLALSSIAYSTPHDIVCSCSCACKGRAVLCF